MTRLDNIWRDADHERGCEGRCYTCSCGFDAATLETAELAAEALVTLQAERDEWKAEYERRDNDVRRVADHYVGAIEHVAELMLAAMPFAELGSDYVHLKSRRDLGDEQPVSIPNGLCSIGDFRRVYRALKHVDLHAPRAAQSSEGQPISPSEASAGNPATDEPQ